MLGKDKVGPCLILQLADPSLGYTVLKVSVHTTEGDGLSTPDDLLHEQVLCKASIVRMIVSDPHVV
jgi:hypothetical protein